MRKLFLLALLVLGVASVSYAISIPEAEDPANGPAIWVVPVYNNSGSTMDIGDVAVWDISSSTGDDDNYVTTTTTADTAIVAGVVYGADIAAASYGLLAVHGVVPVDVTSGLNSAGGLACSSGTAGGAKSCDTQANAFGIVTNIAASGTAEVFLRGLQ